jgi:hypothetical protein
MLYIFYRKKNTDAEKARALLGDTIREMHAPPENFENQVSQIG